MFPSRRTLGRLFALTLVVVAAALIVKPAALLVASQPMTAPVTPAQAAPYLGDWTAAITSQMGPTTYSVSVKVDAAKVVATVGGGMFPAAPASEIYLSGKNLFLKYVSNFQGMSIPGLIAMTPDGSDMLLTISILDGQMEMAGRATKGGAPAAATSGQTGRGAGPAQGPAGGPPPQAQVARVTDLMQMMSALPDTRTGHAEAAAARAGAGEGRRGSCTHRFRSRRGRSRRWDRRPARGRPSSPTTRPTSPPRTCSSTTRSSSPSTTGHVPRRSGRSGRDRRTAQGAARFRAQRQGDRRHSRRDRLVSRRGRRRRPAPPAQARLSTAARRCGRNSTR